MKSNQPNPFNEDELDLKENNKDDLEEENPASWGTSTDDDDDSDI